MRTAMRTHACGHLRASDADADVALCGWVAHRRDHGGVTFIDLRDREGVVQLVFHPGEAPEAHAAAQSLGSEDVVRVTGVVRARPAGMVNPTLDTGEMEVAVGTLELLSESATPPFPIEDRAEAGEDIRLKYRYLDLRRPEMTKILRLRHTVNRIMREHMESFGFIEVETPLLTRSTPEGARDFLVPARLAPGSVGALCDIAYDIILGGFLQPRSSANRSWMGNSCRAIEFVVSHIGRVSQLICCRDQIRHQVVAVTDRFVQRVCCAYHPIGRVISKAGSVLEWIGDLRAPSRKIVGLSCTLPGL